jgi:SRSO17 transposase
VLDDQAWPLLRRLTRWLDQFKDCFGHRAQRVSLRQYVDGLLSDSPRKSMSAMLARVTEPGSYQALQHFVTDAPWNADAVWRRLRAILPERRGILILDETSFPKQGPHSVGVARQYCGALGKVANCQVAVTAALWTGRRAWALGALLYVPEAWTADADRRTTARIPPSLRFQEKWRLALTLLRQVRAANLSVTAVVADAEYGDNSTLRQALHRAKLPYALGISPTLTVFLGTPALHIDRGQRPPRIRREG